jgi:hypothetical protein
MPNLYAVADDCNRVAAHVHAETMPAAIRPVGTERLALLNSSAFATLWDVYRVCSLVMTTIKAEKNRPMPIWCRVSVLCLGG